MSDDETDHLRDHSHISVEETATRFTISVNKTGVGAGIADALRSRARDIARGASTDE